MRSQCHPRVSVTLMAHSRLCLVHCGSMTEVSEWWVLGLRSLVFDLRSLTFGLPETNIGARPMNQRSKTKDQRPKTKDQDPLLTFLSFLPERFQLINRSPIKWLASLVKSLFD